MGGLSPPKPLCWQNQQASISKTVLPNHARWNIVKTRLQLMALIENIALNIKNSMRYYKNCFFIIFVIAICGKPTPEIRFFRGSGGEFSCPRSGRYGVSLRGPGLNHPTFQSRGARSTTEPSPPKRNVRRQCLDVRWCSDVPLGHC